MNAAIPWAPLLALIEPHAPKAECGRQPLGGAEKMLRTYCLQQPFDRSDPAVADIT